MHSLFTSSFFFCEEDSQFLFLHIPTDAVGICLYMYREG